MPLAPAHPARRKADRRVELRTFLLVVSMLGAVALVVYAPAAAADLAAASPGVLMLCAFVLIGELLPIKVPGHDEEVTTSGPFMYALLVGVGLPVAALAQAVGSVVGDVRARKSPLACAFNVGQYTLALVAAGLVMRALGGAGGIQLEFAPASIVPLLAAGLAFSAANNVLAGTAAALAQGEPITRYLFDDLRFQTLMAAVVVGFTPLVLAVVDHEAWMVPLLVLPLLTLHRGTRAARLSEHQATHDTLTGLPNRKRFRARAERALDATRAHGEPVAVLVMDLDRFKEVNDTLGHHFGDLLLQGIAQRVRGTLRPGDTIARFGGDEFAILLERVGPDDALLVAERIRTALEAPFDVAGLQLEADASIGIAVAPAHGDDVDTLLQRGDVAMYVAKAEHAGCCVYDPASDTNSVDRLALVGELRTALETDQLVLHYQPQVALDSHATLGIEALVRWQHPDRGLLAPDEFIPLAERTGLIRPLTLHVLDLALAQAAAWRAEGLDLAMSVNASSRDLLDPRMPAEVGARLARHGLPGSALTLEITESTLMADPRRARILLGELSALGIRLAVDDFGTGYSSLSYLKDLPIDCVKIDRSFVSGMITDPSDSAIVASTVDLARNLGMSTVAEGVEDEAAFAQLQRMGCDAAQGFWMSRPLPADDLTAWVRARVAPFAVAA